MLCSLEIAMLVFGIMSLVNGKLTLDKKTGLRGAPAYFAGFLMILPMPIALVAGFYLGFTAAQEGWDEENVEWLILGIEAGVTLGILAIVLLICAIAGETFPRDRRARRRDEEYDDEYDDRPRRRYRDDVSEDEEDDRQWEELRRRRARYRQPDDEMDDRRRERDQRDRDTRDDFRFTSDD